MTQHTHTHLRDLAGLVVASEQRHVRGPACFEQQQQRERLQRVVPAVHKVALRSTAITPSTPPVLSLSADIPASCFVVT